MQHFSEGSQGPQLEVTKVLPDLILIWAHVVHVACGAAQHSFDITL
jgi:hypothetical protein